MLERYSLPKTEKKIRYSPDNWPKDLLERFIQNWPAKNEVTLTDSFVVTEHPGLGYRRFMQGEGNKVNFELLVTDEANELLARSGKVKTKQEIRRQISKISKNPFGPLSLDPLIRGKEAKSQKEILSINSFDSTLEERLGTPIAIKGSRPKTEENLAEQFLHMRKLEEEWQHLPEYIKNILHICKVYAAIRRRLPRKEKYEQWLIMERIPNAKQVTNEILEEFSSPEPMRGFPIGQNPLLAEIIKKEIKNPKSFPSFSEPGIGNCYDWNTFIKALKNAGLNLTDIAGRNLLYTEDKDEPAKKQYIVIDQGGRNKS